MIVGFVITNFKEHEQEAIEFIRTVCILENPQTAENIVKAGEGINIFSTSVTQEMLDAQPFDAMAIERGEGEYLVVSAVNFPLELSYLGELRRLQPTEFLRVSPIYIEQFNTYINKGLLKQVPKERSIVSEWVLEDGVWGDARLWLDDNYWRDSL